MTTLLYTSEVPEWKDFVYLWENVLYVENLVIEPLAWTFVGEMFEDTSRKYLGRNEQVLAFLVLLGALWILQRLQAIVRYADGIDLITPPGWMNYGVAVVTYLS